MTTAFSAGGHGGADLPVPIPNTEVKGPIAEGSAGVARARVGRRRLFFLSPRAQARKGRGASRGPALLFFPAARPAGLSVVLLPAPVRLGLIIHPLFAIMIAFR